MITAAIITIGDEILYGQTLDTNAHFMSQQLSDAGYKTVGRISVGDNAEDIKWALNLAESISQIILISGGLGPTRDDITKKTLTEYFDTVLVLNTTALADVTEFFSKRGVELSDINRRQAYIPSNGKVIRNVMGTAPGIWIEKDAKVFVSMPGVPHEIDNMVKSEVIPKLREKFPPPVILHKIIMTAGIGESILSEMIRSWEDELPRHMKLAYLPGLGQVKLRLTVTGDSLEMLESEADQQIRRLTRYIRQYIYSYENDPLEKTIGDLLRKSGMKISVAESCTGGHIGHMITSIPGSSDYFPGGIIAYENSIKENLLGVRTETLKNFGAVSEETVKEMAEGVRKKFKSDIGLATSGIAGPGGGTKEKPVGLVWIGISDNEGNIAKRFIFSKNRITNIQFFTVAALTFLWQRITQNAGIPH
jgi:nicotinamide-nucleotide amidase